MPHDRTGRLLSEFFDALLDRYGPQGWWPGRTREEVMIGAVLTQNTAWRNVERAIENLRQHQALDFARLHAIDASTLAAWIRPAGTFNVKAGRLKALTDWIFARFDGDLDRMFATPMSTLREELLTVRGIGRETCDAILLYAGRMPTFVVDAYTHRVLRRHGLIDAEADYEEIKSLLESHLAPNVEMYNEFHALLVAVGKEHCRPRARCEGCPLEGFEHELEDTTP